ncbi:MAG: DUF3782 domain-containing protein [Bacteroidia bacterium]|nr:DUF3782 domain-containing protein [Bacteroidia bacterium]
MEHTFRETIKGILERQSGVKVERYIQKDTDGFVFGRPAPIRNGGVIAAEIKSSMDEDAVYVFLRKVEFYERREGVKVQRRIVISPMIYPEALRVAEAEGVEVYSYPEEL